MMLYSDEKHTRKIDTFEMEEVIKHKEAPENCCHMLLNITTSFLQNIRVNAKK